MRLTVIFVTLFIFLACPAVMAQSPQQIDLTGYWIFSWDNDPNNANTANLKQGMGTITGSYINDAKENCPITGRITSLTAVTITITCPNWDIKADGSIVDSNLVIGSYFAYGSTHGIYRMVRK